MKTIAYAVRALPACLAGALLVLTGCASSPTRHATEELSTLPALGYTDDAELRAPIALRQDEPVFPLDLKRAGIGGVVYVDFVVDENGRVADATAHSNSNGELTASALRAVKTWSFSPGQRNGETVPMRVNMPIIFTFADP